MKKTLSALIVIIIIFCISACSNDSVSKETNPLIGKIYTHNTLSEKTFDFEFVKFYNDNTFQGIHTTFRKNTKTGENEPVRTNYYGTYEINDNALNMSMSKDSFSGVIVEDGNKISFGNDEFINWTEHIGIDDPLLSEFK